MFDWERYEKGGAKIEKIADDDFRYYLSERHYQTINEFKEGLALVKNKEGFYGYINEHGNEILPCVYSEAHSFSEGLALVRFKSEHYFDGLRFIDKSGNFLRHSFTFAKDFREGLAAVKNNEYSSYRYINIQGKVEIDLDSLRVDFSVREIFSFSEGLAQIVTPQGHGYIDKKGQIVINFKYDGSEPFINGKAKVSKKGKVGYINKLGNEIIPIEYDSIKTYINGILIVSKDKKWGAIHEAGVVVIPCESESEEVLFNKELTKLNLVNFYDVELEHDISIQKFKKSIEVDKGTTHFEEIELYGLVDNQGRTIVPCVFNYIDTAFFYRRVLFNDKWGYINDSGKLVIPCQYEDVGQFDRKSSAKETLYLAKVKNNNKWGYIDSKANEIIPCIYDELRGFHNNLCYFCIDEKVGYIDRTGKLVIPPKYDKSTNIQTVDFLKDYVIVEKGKKFGIIDKNGNEIAPAIYDIIEILDSEIRSRLLSCHSFYKKEQCLTKKSFIKRSEIPFAKISIENTFNYINNKGDILECKEKSKPINPYRESYIEWLEDNDFDALDAFEGDSDAYWIWKNG